MITVLVAGAGQCGAHAVRQLAASRGIDRVLVVDPQPGRAATLAEAVGDTVEAHEGAAEEVLSRSPELLVSAAPGGVDLVRLAVEEGIPSASCDDDPDTVQALLDVDAAAAAAGVRVVVGAGLSPGLSEILSRYAAEGLDEIDEVHVARYGIAGPACARTRRGAGWGAVDELCAGAWQSFRAGTGRRLVAFPSPVGTHDCRRIRSATTRLVARALPGVTTVTARDAFRRRDRLTGGVARPTHEPRGRFRFGAVHVEVRGRRGSGREVLVYGAVDHMASAVGTVLAVAALVAGELLPTVAHVAPGVVSLGQLEPAPLLGELGRRGVRAAQFVGADAAA